MTGDIYPYRCILWRLLYAGFDKGESLYIPRMRKFRLANYFRGRGYQSKGFRKNSFGKIYKIIVLLVVVLMTNKVVFAANGKLVVIKLFYLRF